MTGNECIFAEGLKTVDTNEFCFVAFDEINSRNDYFSV